MRPAVVALPAIMALLQAAGRPAVANPRSEALRREAFAQAYSLNHEAAVASARSAIEADPDDPGAHRALAAILWLNLLFDRGSVTVDDYLGSISQPNLELKAPPAGFTTEFRSSLDKAISLSDVRLRRAPDSADAHYDVGAAAGRLAAYMASVEGKTLDSLTTASRAFDEHGRALKLAPSRKDTGLVLGTYRYLVATLPVFKRWMAYVIGLRGGKETAVRLLRDCAAYPSDVQTEARFVLVVVFNRERRYDEAEQVLAALRREYPSNRLLWLESGATALRAGRPPDARAFLDEGLAMFERDARRKSFGEAALWHYKRGAAHVLLNDPAQASTDLQAALTFECRDWVRGRVHTELGKLADLAGNRAAALQAYRKAASLGRADRDALGADEARKLIESPFRHSTPAGGRE